MYKINGFVQTCPHQFCDHWEACPILNFRVIFLYSGTLVNAGSRSQVFPGLALLLLIFARLREMVFASILKYLAADEGGVTFSSPLVHLRTLTRSFSCQSKYRRCHILCIEKEHVKLFLVSFCYNFVQCYPKLLAYGKLKSVEPVLRLNVGNVTIFFAKFTVVFI